MQQYGITAHCTGKVVWVIIPIHWNKKYLELSDTDRMISDSGCCINVSLTLYLLFSCPKSPLLPHASWDTEKGNISHWFTKDMTYVSPLMIFIWMLPPSCGTMLVTLGVKTVSLLLPQEMWNTEAAGGAKSHASHTGRSLLHIKSCMLFHCFVNPQRGYRSHKIIICGIRGKATHTAFDNAPLKRPWRRDASYHFPSWPQAENIIDPKCVSTQLSSGDRLGNGLINTKSPAVINASCSCHISVCVRGFIGVWKEMFVCIWRPGHPVGTFMSSCPPA